MWGPCRQVRAAHRTGHTSVEGPGLGPRLCHRSRCPGGPPLPCPFPSSPGVHWDHRRQRLPGAAVCCGRDRAATFPWEPLPGRRHVSKATQGHLGHACVPQPVTADSLTSGVSSGMSRAAAAGAAASLRPARSVQGSQAVKPTPLSAVSLRCHRPHSSPI